VENTFDLVGLNRIQHSRSVGQISPYQFRLTKLATFEVGVRLSIKDHNSVATLHEWNYEP